MTRESAFTESEWVQLSDLPRLAAFGAMAADEGDAIAATRELWAGMMEMIQSARDHYPNNALIQELARAASRDEGGADVSRAGWKPGAEPLDAAMLEHALRSAARARRILAERATVEEAAEYAAWVLEIAQAAAAAARTGLFGFGGEQVTERESAYVRDLATMLGVS